MCSGMTEPLLKLFNQIEDSVQNFLANENIKSEITDFGINKSPQKKFGDYNTSICFRLAKILRENPNNIAERLLNSIDANEYSLIDEVKREGAYVNYFIN
ncbi:MAG: hypothetical protein GF329_20085, partial [Candidatus Lokiarchaeota archaeon]|nr:hypothetical protein [Candidatus Lokiarchaeota archaeon]